MSISSFRSLIIMSLTGLTIWTSPLPLFAEDEAIAPLTVELGRDVNFDDDISPILKANCLACHNGLKKEGSLNLETVAGMLAGGDSGTSLVPGKADESYLFKVAARQEEPLMPPLPNKMNAHKLTGQEVWKLQQWINAGAIPGQKSAQSAIVWNSTLNRLQPVYALSLIPGESLVAVGRGPFLELLSLNRPDQSVLLIDPNLQSSAHRDFVNAITAHPSGRILASAGFRSVKIWEQPEIAELAAAQSAAPVAAWTTLVSRAGVASIDTAGQLTLLLPEASNTFSTNELEVKAVAIKSDSSEVAVIRKEGNEVAVIKLTGPPTPVVFAVPVPATHICYQEAQLVTAHQDGSIRIWDAAADGTTWAVNGAEFRVDNQPFQQFSLTSERELLTCSSSGEVVLWDLAKRAPAKKWNAGADVTGCETAPLGERFATLHQNGAVRIWDAQGKMLHEWQSAGHALLSISGVERQIAIAKSLSTYAQAQEKASDTDVQERTKSVETAKENIKKAEEALEKAKAPAEEAQKALTDAETKLAAEPENDGLKKAKEEAAKKQESAQQTLKEAETTLERAKTTLGLEEQALKRSQEKLQERVASAKTRAEDVTKLEADLKTQRDALGQNILDGIGISFADPVCIRILTRTGHEELWNCQTGLPVSVSVNPVWSGVNRVQALLTDTLATITDDNRLRILNCNPAWQ
ncbi:MAG: hypothetical protein KDA78_18980, partial [Planctomycetaceae bacterium]|nr:hypothetical protein [Planctomycetaceae bacterium]